MIKILILIGIIYVTAILTSPYFWKGGGPPSRRRKRTADNGEKPYGLPWMGGTLKRRDKNFWDD